MANPLPPDDPATIEANERRRKLQAEQDKAQADKLALQNQGGATYDYTQDRGAFGDPASTAIPAFNPLQYNINSSAYRPTGPFNPYDMQAQAANANERQRPQFDFGYQNQSRDAQMLLMQQLQAQASGQGPSLAQLQLQRGQDSALANAMAMGASQRGANQAGSLRAIGTQQAGIQQGLAADSAALRLQEQMQAQQQLMGLTGQMRGQDIGAAGAQAQFAQQGQKMNDEMVQFYTSQGMSLQDAQMKAAQELEKLRVQQNIAMQKMQQESSDSTFRTSQEKQTADVKAGLEGTGMVLDVIGGGAGAAAMSDENVKTDIAPADMKLYEFLDKLDSHSYHYKDEKHGKGERVSVMAQELQKSDLGDEFVFDTEDGLGVDYGKGLGTMLAAQAALHKRLKKLEEKE